MTEMMACLILMTQIIILAISGLGLSMLSPVDDMPISDRLSQGSPHLHSEHPSPPQMATGQWQKGAERAGMF